MKCFLIVLLICPAFFRCEQIDSVRDHIHRFQIEKNAKEGDAAAQFSLGIRVFNGWYDSDGPPPDEIGGLEWIRKAANQGYYPGQWYLAMHYITGYGSILAEKSIQIPLTPIDDKEGMKWLELAADQEKSGAEYIWNTLLNDFDVEESHFPAAIRHCFEESFNQNREFEEIVAAISAHYIIMEKHRKIGD